MTFSVIIPTCNRNDMLLNCLNLIKFKEGSSITDDYEIIVSDDSKNSLSRQLVENLGSEIIWVKGPGKGPAANRNNGAKYAKGEWLVFLDDDCLPCENFVSRYQESIVKYPATIAFEGAILPNDWKLLDKDLAECPINISGNCFWSANICVKASVFKTLNGFNEEYLIAAQEDQQLKIDLESFTGEKIIFLPNCFVIHPVRFTSIKKQLRKIPMAAKNFSLYAVKNKIVLNYPSLYRFGMQQFYHHFRSFAKSFVKGKFRNAVVSLAWIVYGVPLNIRNFSELNRAKSLCSIALIFLICE